MRELTVFEAVVEPNVERIPLVDVRRFDIADGRECEISHLIYRNVFTDFDQKLSRHLAAVSGSGFPSITASIRIRERKPEARWHNGRSLHFGSVPHALRGVAARALKNRETATLHIHAPDAAALHDDMPGASREIGKGEVAALTAALEFCTALGEIEFMNISGDYDLLVANLEGSDLRPVTIDLFRGSLTIQGGVGDAKDVVEAPLFDHRRLVLENPAVRSYLAATRHALAARKEDAVMAFRSAAEDRIFSFDRALAGRPLADYRLDAVTSLVSRLKAGLGDNLAGLSEAAQITALEWSASIDHAAANADDADRVTPLDPLIRGPRRATP